MLIPLSRNEVGALKRQVKFGDSVENSAYQDRLIELQNQVPFDFQEDSEELIAPLIKAMLNMATQKYLNAAYGGVSNDGGASQVVSELAGVIVGFQMAKEGCLMEPYSTIVAMSQIHSDPDYQKYKELHKKFRGVEPE
jgi:hypothetical protein